MPGLAQRNDQLFCSTTTSSSSSTLYSSLSCTANGFWSKHHDDVSYNLLQKFWSELSPHARQELLRVDKQTFFEQARKNMYCSRCNGLLLEGFLQIVMYGKSLQQEGQCGHLTYNRPGFSKSRNDGVSAINNGCQDEIQDPAVHPWGGLTTTRDGTLTLLDCFLFSKSLKGLQNVFDSARARERERELLYPDACGGGGRGWISQGMSSYGRGHGTRETCALHTARLSCDTLVDFWSALGEETRQSLLRMKEEDFIERLMYRFDSKRFCRDCRRNVIREFKELKELKRMRREPRCTSWFCVADAAFQYEVSDDTVQADWHQTFTDTIGTCHHFEWAIGTGEGKSDILDFENVGMNGSVLVNGLNLTGFSACFITLRAWKLDGRCTELSVKAHALKGQQCIHCRLAVGDGFVTITRGESIRRFFEDAEEAEEEEDDDSVDKDGNELDGECSRPQKHAKSPELAREFLLDAATVIFKEQVEKAFREGTARQNAHSIFVCLALKLLEERVHVACKEIITLEKQMKLLEEEEKEKREEEERKERRRTREREKKLRRKERLKGKEKDREKKCSESNEVPVVADVSKEELAPDIDEEPDNAISDSEVLGYSEDNNGLSSPMPTVSLEEEFSHKYPTSERQSFSYDSADSLITIENPKFSRRKPKLQKELHTDHASKWPDRHRYPVELESGAFGNKSEPRYHGGGMNGLNRQSRINSVKSNGRNTAPKFGEKFHSNHRINDRYESHLCSCISVADYRSKVDRHVSAVRLGREIKSGVKPDSSSEMSKPLYRGNKYNQTDYSRENFGRPKTKLYVGNNLSRDVPYTKQVWEPLESQKKYPRSNSDSDVILRSSSKADDKDPNNHLNSSDSFCAIDVSASTGKHHDDNNNTNKSRNFSPLMGERCENGFHIAENSACYMKKVGDEDGAASPVRNAHSDGSLDNSMSSTSNSDNCSSCPSEADSNTASSNLPNLESSSTSDSEDASQQSEGRETLVCVENGFSECRNVGMEKKQNSIEGLAFKSTLLPGSQTVIAGTNLPGNQPMKPVPILANGKGTVSLGSQPQGLVPPMQNQSIHYPVFQAPPALAYYHQHPVSWPANHANGLMPFSHLSHYVLPLGFGLNGNSHFCMQYGVPHMTGPLLNASQVPVYQPIPRASTMDSKEQGKVSNPVAMQEGQDEVQAERVGAGGQGTAESPPSKCGQNGNSAKLQMGNSSFSLFHFGGPAALSTGNNPNPVSSKDGDLTSNLSTDHVEGDHACNKKETTIEEYNLFAASNGLKFSFF
ncbi:hypothetical protein RJ641_027330 [Dillenia turbinata]|uniref:Stress response protein NST1 n=1 Tax=Dillenia turbinata TaxID=194707 RepID=A0AAN8W8M8_9MAGN